MNNITGKSDRNLGSTMSQRRLEKLLTGSKRRAEFNARRVAKGKLKKKET